MHEILKVKVMTGNIASLSESLDQCKKCKKCRKKKNSNGFHKTTITVSHNHFHTSLCRDNSVLEEGESAQTQCSGVVMVSV